LKKRINAKKERAVSVPTEAGHRKKEAVQGGGGADLVLPEGERKEDMDRDSRREKGLNEEATFGVPSSEKGHKKKRFGLEEGKKRGGHFISRKEKTKTTYEGGNPAPWETRTTSKPNQVSGLGKGARENWKKAASPLDKAGKKGKSPACEKWGPPGLDK